MFIDVTVFYSLQQNIKKAHRIRWALKYAGAVYQLPNKSL